MCHPAGEGYTGGSQAQVKDMQSPRPSAISASWGLDQTQVVTTQYEQASTISGQTLFPADA